MGLIHEIAGDGACLVELQATFIDKLISLHRLSSGLNVQPSGLDICREIHLGGGDIGCLSLVVRSLTLDYCGREILIIKQSQQLAGMDMAAARDAELFTRRADFGHDDRLLLGVEKRARRHDALNRLLSSRRYLHSYDRLRLGSLLSRATATRNGHAEKGRNENKWSRCVSSHVFKPIDNDGLSVVLLSPSGDHPLLPSLNKKGSRKGVGEQRFT